MQFSHVALNCVNVEEMIAFYRAHFGFAVSRRLPIGEGKEIVYIRREDMRLELFPADTMGEAASHDGPATIGTVRHFAFQVEDVDATLAAMGSDAKVSLGPLDFDAFIPGWRTAWLRDPSGHIVEISQGYKE
ncbi:MAG: VOC family protein [Roseiarcus sp.]